MLRSGLTSDLIDALAVIAGELVTHQGTIQRKLMNEVFKNLGWESLRVGQIGEKSYGKQLNRLVHTNMSTQP